MITSATYWILLAVAVPVFWVLPARRRGAFLALVSIGYLASLDWLATLIMAAWSVAFYVLAPHCAKGGVRRLGTLLVLALLAYLGWFKYAPALLHKLLGGFTFAAEIAVPLGISYFTFKLIHYLVEVARGNVADRSLGRFLCWVFLFPIFTGGPIERFDHFLTHGEERFRRESAAAGLQRIVFGLIKRFVFAEQLLLLHGDLDTGVLLQQLPVLGTGRVWEYCILKYLFAYLDFSALSDIAIGSSRLFGFTIMENFRWPILARNIGDFWKRWHMTLAGWCQSYVYLPTIGLSRRPYLAVYATFVTMGLWHAGSLHWLGWGLYHATGVSVYLTWGRIRRRLDWPLLDSAWLGLLGVPLTFLFVTGGYAFTSVWTVDSVYGSLRILAKLCGLDLPA
jgi:alginate O-acetyltransferase complex protein AlgI